MKKIFTKILPLSMAIVMAFGSIIPVFATVTENQAVETIGNTQTEVIYNQESTFGVTIPKAIDLGVDKTTAYSITVFGDFASDETIFVVPDDSFYMKDKNTSNPKDDVEAVVTQNKTEWKFNELETIGNGNVTAENLTAGTWEGKFYFNIKLDNCNISVIATNEAGENLNASATYITGSEKENLLNSLEESGLIGSKEEVSEIINVDSDDFDGIANTTFDVSAIASEGEKVAILHFDEDTQEWELIGTEIVDENGLVSGNFISYSPIVFVKITEEGIYEIQTHDFIVESYEIGTKSYTNHSSYSYGYNVEDFIVTLKCEKCLKEYKYSYSGLLTTYSKTYTSGEKSWNAISTPGLTIDTITTTTKIPDDNITIRVTGKITIHYYNSSWYPINNMRDSAIYKNLEFTLIE